ncbi:hypothetical protein ACFLTE_01090 [Bacteroidota bacterium]
MKLKNIKIRIIQYLFISGIIISCNNRNNQDKKPNIVIVLTDDQGWGDLSLNGNPFL